MSRFVTTIAPLAIGGAAAALSDNPETMLVMICIGIFFSMLNLFRGDKP